MIATFQSSLYLVKLLGATCFPRVSTMLRHAVGFWRAKAENEHATDPIITTRHNRVAKRTWRVVCCSRRCCFEIFRSFGLVWLLRPMKIYLTLDPKYGIMTSDIEVVVWWFPGWRHLASTYFDETLLNHQNELKSSQKPRTKAKNLEEKLLQESV